MPSDQCNKETIETLITGAEGSLTAYVIVGKPPIGKGEQVSSNTCVYGLTVDRYH